MMKLTPSKVSFMKWQLAKFLMNSQLELVVKDKKEQLNKGLTQDQLFPLWTQVKDCLPL